jgi:hypothetical protein
MTIIKTRRIDLKQITIDKFDSLIKDKYKLLKSDTIYFEKEKGEVLSVTCSDGYNVFVRKNGYRIFPRAVDGKELLDIIDCVKNDKFFTYIKIKDQNCKVRPKVKR